MFLTTSLRLPSPCSFSSRALRAGPPSSSLSSLSPFSPSSSLSPPSLSPSSSSSSLSTLSPSPFSSPSSLSSLSSLSPSSSSSLEKREPKLHPWLFVGLGNPGSKYEGTRHNVGFELIDAFAQAEGIKLNTVQQRALTGKGVVAGVPVILAKPQTYVNLSGESIGPLGAYYRIPSRQIVVIYDDMDLEFPLLRILPKGGHGSHNGMRDIIENLKTRDFPRLRLGIGKPPGTMDPKAFVLQLFSTLEREEMDITIARGVDALRDIVVEGVEEAGNVWNQIQKSRMKLVGREDTRILDRL